MQVAENNKINCKRESNCRKGRRAKDHTAGNAFTNPNVDFVLFADMHQCVTVAF